MAERSIKAILRAEVGQFTSAMGQAATAAESVGTAAESGAQKAASAQQKQTTQARSFSQNLAQSARDNEQAWSTVGATIGGAGAAVTAMTGLVAHAGIEYNSLRQTATAALTSVTGSAEAAADQMARMDEFGSSSWLMRDSIIRAQQQMTGFGIETSKVIGYMDALQEAVAGTGGSSQTFEELAFVMAKVESQGKITATELNEFGQRGVDAAALIGDAMGMTADQIRSSITAGTLDASDALDALAQGMMNRYEGASDLVRNTFRGAVDDVQAAIRDIGAIAFGNLVDPEGGGLLVDLLNQISGFLFALRDVPPEILQVGGAIAGLGGLAATAAGGLALAIPRYVAFTDSLAVLAETAPRAAGALGGFARVVGRGALWGAALTGAAVGLGALSKVLHSPAVAKSAEDIATEIERITEAGRRLDTLYLPAVFEEMPTWAGMATTEARNLGDALDKLADPSWSDKLSQAAGAIGLPSYMDDYATMVAGVDEALAGMVDGGQAEQVQAILEGTGRSAEFLAEQMPQATAALAESADAAEAAAQPWAGMAEAMEGIGQLAAEVAAGLGDTGEMLKEAFSQDAPATLQDIAEGYRAQADALRDYNSNLADTYQIIGSGSLDEHQLGMDWLADLMASGDEQHIAMTLDLFVNGSEEDRALLLDEFADREAEATMHVDVQDEAMQSLEERIAELEEGAEIQISAEPRVAREVIGGLLMEIDGTTGRLSIGGDPTDGLMTLNEFLGQVGTSAEDVTINGDPANGMSNLQLLMNMIAGSEEDVIIGGENEQGVRALELLVDLINRSRGNVTVDADTAVAMSRLEAINNTLNSINGKTVTATVAIRQYGQAAVASGGYMGDFLAGGGQPRKRYTLGGEVFGPGSPTSDDIPAMLSRKEFVTRAAAVDYYGVDAMYALNAKHVPRENLRAALGYADGGYAGHGPVPATISPMINVSTPTTGRAGLSRAEMTAAVRDAMTGMNIRMTGTDVLTDTVSGTILTAIGAS